MARRARQKQRAAVAAAGWLHAKDEQEIDPLFIDAAFLLHCAQGPEFTIQVDEALRRGGMELEEFRVGHVSPPFREVV
jgi:preprotein translocase subunit Sec61beta